MPPERRKQLPRPATIKSGCSPFRRKGSPELKTDVNSKWEVCSPNTVAGFTAVGYFFGRDLQKNIAVPIGLINSNFGGTTAEPLDERSRAERRPRVEGDGQATRPV